MAETFGVVGHRGSVDRVGGHDVWMVQAGPTPAVLSWFSRRGPWCALATA